MDIDRAVGEDMRLEYTTRAFMVVTAIISVVGVVTAIAQFLGIDLMSWWPVFGDAAQYCGVTANARSSECIAIVSVRAETFSAIGSLGGLLIGVLTLASVIFGFWQARKTQRTEYRPYLRLISVDTSFGEEGHVLMGLCLTNYGRTPASSVVGDIKVLANETGGLGAGQFGPISDKFTLDRAHCGEGQLVECQTTERFGNNVTNMVNGGVGLLIVTVNLHYTDVFKEGHSETFEFKFSGRYDASKTTGPLKPNYKSPVQMRS